MDNCFVASYILQGVWSSEKQYESHSHSKEAGYMLSEDGQLRNDTLKTNTLCLAF